MQLTAEIAAARHMFIVQLVALLIFLSPILASAFLVMFRGNGVRGRWLFLLVGPVIVYTVLWLAMLIFLVPAWFVLTWFTPAVVDLVHSKPFWYPVFSWVAEYDGYIASLVALGLTLWLVGHFWPRWPAILAALTSRPGTPEPRSSSITSPRGEA